MGLRAQVTLVLSAALLVWPALGAAQDVDEARALLRLIGYDVAARQVQHEFREPPEDFPPELRAAWKEAAADRFQSEEIFETAVTQLQGALTVEEIGALEDYLSTGLGARVTAMEAAAQSPEQADRIEVEKQEFIEALGSEFAPRFELLKDTADALQMVESSVVMVLNISYSIASGMMASGLLPAPMTEDDILASLAKQEPQIRATVRHNVLRSIAYTYRDLTDAELQAYTDFLKSEPAQAIYSVMDRSLEHVVRRDCRALGRELIELSKQERL